MHIVHSSFGLHTDTKCFITDEVIAGANGICTAQSERIYAHAAGQF